MSAPAGVDPRAAFRQALDDAERGVAATPDSAELRGYLLYPDLQGARLLHRLRKTPDPALDREIEAFLDAQAVLPVANELRRAWLLSLADRRQWRAFLKAYRPDAAEPALLCHAFQARIETQADPETLARELRDFWQDAPQMPQACVPPFTWLKDRGLLTPPVVERRARKALADGNLELADWLIRMLPDATAAPLQQWARLLRNPDAELRAIAARGAPSFEWDAFGAGYKRLAIRDPDRAVMHLSQLPPEWFSADQYAELKRHTALGLSWDRRPEAVAWFRQLPEHIADSDVREWRIRAALWNGDIETASMWLHALPPEQAAEPRWTYWRARSLERLGRDQQAHRLYDALAGDNGYYSVLAAWRSGQPYRPQARAFADDLIAQSLLLERVEVLRARELFLAGRDAWASVQWRRAVRDLDPTQKMQAARLASAWGWHEQAVRILDEFNALDVLELSYPDEFAGPIRAAAEDTGLPSAWVYGLMRQESLFNPRAVSPSNAYGLLQLLLPTAREVARRRGERPPSARELLDPDINVPLGATYLREMRERFDGQFPPAVAAYNAGPNAVKRWLPAQPLDADVWIENVPYNETRKYVQRVLWHIAAHEWRRSGESLDPSRLLQPVRAPAQ